MAKITFKNDIKPKICSSNDFITYNWKEIQIISAEYSNYSGLTILSYHNLDDPSKRLSYYISKRGKDISGFNLDIINRTPNETVKYDGAHTIALVGGSSMGLESICGIQEIVLKDNIYWYNKILNEKERNEQPFLPLHERIYGVCCYTKNLSIDRNYIYPDLKLGKFAMKNLYKNARSKIYQTQKIYLKQSGVGLNSTVAKLNTFGKNDNSWAENYVLGGVGAKFFEKDDLKILIIINLNSVGLVHDNYKLLHEFPKGANNIGEDIRKYNKNLNKLKDDILNGTNKNLKPSNTTLSIICTNMEIPDNLKEKLTEELHDEIESMIFPYGTIEDGDTLFLCSTWDISYQKNFKDLTKPLIRECIKSVFINNQKGGAKENYNELYLKYKLKYLNSKKKIDL